MRVVIEGVDGTGKTFLARRLSHEYGCRVWHSARPIDRADLQNTMQIMSLAGKFDEHIVYDRFHAISEYIYRDFGGLDYIAVIRWLRYCKVDKIIHMTVLDPSHVRIVDNSNMEIEDRIQHERVRKDLVELIARYCGLMRMLSGVAGIEVETRFFNANQT
jgi:broad-specificity NMP kinase